MQLCPIVVGVSAVGSMHVSADEDLPSAVNIFDVSNVSAAGPTDCCQCSSCEFLLLLLASLLNVAGFSPVTGFPTV